MTVMPTRFVRRAGPGEFRGEGEWWPFDGDDETWEGLKSTGYLPVAEAAPARDGEGTYIDGGWMYHRAGFRAPVREDDEGHVRYVQRQLEALVEQREDVFWRSCAS